MLVPRSQMGCIVLDDCLYVLGGTNRRNEVLQSVERYHFKEDRYINISHLNFFVLISFKVILWILVIAYTFTRFKKKSHSFAQINRQLHYVKKSSCSSLFVIFISQIYLFVDESTLHVLYSPCPAPKIWPPQNLVDTNNSIIYN